MTATQPDVYYDPYDWEIDADPYPVFKRLRDEAPLYHNEKYDFYALSRFEDVEKASVELEDPHLGEGISHRADPQRHPDASGKHPFRGPAGSRHASQSPRTGIHASSGWQTSSPRSGSSVPRSLDPLVGRGGFDFVKDLGALMPMRTIGMLLGIPESDQQALRDRIDEGFKMEDGVMPDRSQDGDTYGLGFGQELDEYIDWREQHPSDDLMTALLQAEFEDETGTVRHLTRQEILTYVGPA